MLSKFFTNWEGLNLFYSQPGEGHSFFGKEKITPCRFFFVYTSKARCRKKSYLLPTNIVVSLGSDIWHKYHE